MATSVTDQRAKYVLQELADLASRNDFLMDKMTSLSSQVRRGESIDIPSVADFTVDSDAASGTRRSVTNAALNLLVDRHPGIFLDIPAITAIQNLEGAWAPNIARQAMIQLKNKMDDDLVEYMVQTLAYDTSATYHDNVGSDDLTEADILNCLAAIKNQGGVFSQNLAFAFNPYGMANFSKLDNFVPNFSQAEAGNLGIPQVATLYGVPVYETTSVKRGRTVAASASAVSSGEFTFTVAAGHGVVPGMTIIASGGTNNIASAVAVDSVTATEIVATSGSATDASNGAMTVTIQSCENLLFDRSHVFTAAQALPSMRILEREQSSSDEMQVTSLWGREGRVGRVRVLHSPLS